MFLGLLIFHEKPGKGYVVSCGLNLFQNAQETFAGDTFQLGIHLGDRNVMLKKAGILHEKIRDVSETLGIKITETSAVLQSGEQPRANLGALGCFKKEIACTCINIHVGALGTQGQNLMSLTRFDHQFYCCNCEPLETNF